MTSGNLAHARPKIAKTFFFFFFIKLCPLSNVLNPEDLKMFLF